MNNLPIAKEYLKNIKMSQYLLDLTKATLIDMAIFFMFPMGNIIPLPLVGWLFILFATIPIAWILIVLGWRPQ